jgi:adenosylhomocysteinase
MARAEWTESMVTALEWGPTHLCEMGAELTSALFGTNPLLPGRRLIDEGAGSRVIAGMEATGSGINRLLELADLGYPVVNWDDVPVKEGLHNRHMVGITAWHTFFQRTGLTLHGKRVVVVGYGSVGRGVADAARAYGGSVVVAEPDAGRGLEAQFAGYAVGRLPEVAAGADVVVTATGHPGVVGLETLRGLAEGAFLLNVGHIDYEIDTESMAPYRGEEIIPFVREYGIDGKTVYLFAEGAMANLSAGRGDSINAFDVTLAVMTATVGYMVEMAGRLDPGVRTLPRDVWRRAVEST